MSNEQRYDRNYESRLHSEANYVSGMENSGNYMAARDRLAQDALSMGANSTVAGAQAFRHMMHEIRERETGSVHVREFPNSARGDQVYVELDRRNGQPGGAVLVDNLATRDLYAPAQTQPRGYDPAYSPERYPAVPPAAYPRTDAQAYPPQTYPPQTYPPTGYDRPAYPYAPAAPAPVYDQPLPNQMNYPYVPYATPPFVGTQPIIQANIGFGGGEPWRMREWQHERWEQEHRWRHPYYGGYSGGYDYGGGGGGYEGNYRPPTYYQPAPTYYQAAPAYYGYGRPNPAGDIIAGGLGGAVIGAIAGGRRGAAIGGIAGAGLTAILGG